MTVVSAPADAEVAEVSPEPDEPPTPARSSRERVRTAVLRAVFVLLLVAGVVVFFEYPVTQTWFHSRQKNLQADFKAPHRGLAAGQAAAILQIPKRGVDLVVVQGDGPGELRGGPGHKPDTPLPGRRGNSIIFGHRNAWGGPFKSLAQLKKGDYIVTQIRGKITNPFPVAYRVVSVKHVPETDRRLTGRSRDYRLTLVTDGGGALSNERLVVTAVSGRALKPAPLGPELTVPTESPIFNLTFGIAFASFTAAFVGWVYLRRHYGLLAQLAVVVPLALAGTFALLIDIDLVLPALR